METKAIIRKNLQEIEKDEVLNNSETPIEQHRDEESIIQSKGDFEQGGDIFSKYLNEDT